MIDKYKLYRGREIKLTDKIILKQPTLGQIMDFGEKDYLGVVHTMTASHMDETSIVMLTKAGLDFNHVSDWELFILSHGTIGEGTRLFFNNVDFSKLTVTSMNDCIVLSDNNGFIMDETLYKIIIMYIRAMNNIPAPKFKKVKDDPVQKRMAIEDAQNVVDSYIRKAKFQTEESSQLLPIISYLVAQPGFKHDERTVFNLSIYQFWDAVKRHLAINNAEHLYNGLYSGCLDLKKNPSLNKEMDVTREL